MKPNKDLELRTSVCIGMFFFLIIVQLALFIIVLCWGVTGTSWQNLVSIPIMFVQAALMLSSGKWLAPLLIAIIMPKETANTNGVEGETRG